MFFRIFIVIGIKINKIELKNFENQESFKIYFYYGVRPILISVKIDVSYWHFTVFLNEDKGEGKS